MQRDPQSGTWTEAEDLPGWTESVLGWALCAGVGVDSQWGWWRAEDDEWSLSGERMTGHIWAAVASAGSLPGPGTGDQGDPWPEEGLQTSASLHLPAALSKPAVRGSVEAWPGSPGRTEGKTEGKVKPPAGGLLLRPWLISWVSFERRDALDVVLQQDL